MFTAGVPDETVTDAAGVGSAPDAKSTYAVVPPGTGLIDITLSWPGASTLYLDVKAPAPASNVVVQGRSGVSPVHATILAPQPGAWQLLVRPYAALQETAHLVVRAMNATTMPDASFGTPPYWGEPTFGANDTQVLEPRATGGVAPYSFAWDTNGDGVHETTGAAVTLALPPGDHKVGVKVTDAQGYKRGGSQTVHVLSNATTVTSAICGGNADFAHWSMEFSATHGTCWIHDGHHTYFFGDHVMAFKAAHGYAFSVEQQFSPSAPLDPATLTDPLHRPVTMEVSLDGTHWTTVGYATYGLVVPSDTKNDTYERQKVFFDLTGHGEPFRFLRVHTAPSASQGLSGYLDHTQLLLALDDLGARPAPANPVVLSSRGFSCDAGDNMEHFFPLTHPCTFGGVNRYDAASFYETYFLGDGATLTRIAGNYTEAPFRADDWFANDTLGNATRTAAYLQVSTDGVAWTTVAKVPGTFGTPVPFDLTLPPTSARFVRFFPEYHQNFDLENDPNCGCASEHHAKAFFVHTELQLGGAFPQP